MATQSELDDFAQKWGVSNQARNAPTASEPIRAAPSPADVQGFADKWLQSQSGPTGFNAPPSAVNAAPNIGIGAYERRNDKGEPIPIDQTSGGGIPLSRYWRIAQQSDPESKADLLKKLYPGKAVRILDTGDVTLEVNDSKTGKPKDAILNPAGLDAHDLIDLTAQFPEIGAQMAMAVATRGRGALQRIGQMLSSAVTGGFAGEVRDIASRKAEGIPMRPEDIRSQRTSQTALDFATQGAMLAGAKSFRALSPFATPVAPDSLAFNQREGVDFLNRNFNTDYPTTPGMRTGSPALLAVEAGESPMPGARTVMNAMRDKANRAVWETQRIASGDVMPEEQIGQDAFKQLRQRIVEPLESGLNAARQIASDKGDKRVIALFDEVLGSAPSRVTPSEAGEVGKAAFDRNMIRAQAAVDRDYAKVRELPGGNGDVIPGDSIADAAQSIRESLPAVTKDVDRSTGLLDSKGNPFTSTETARVPLKSGEPDQLNAALADMEKLRGGTVSLDTITEMKKRAFDAISAFRNAHPDAKDRWFTQISSAYENGLQSAIDNTENLDLKNALSAARDTYKREMVPMERVGVRELAKDAFDPGNLSPEEVTTRLFEGPKAIQNYKLLEETLGPDNVAFRAMKRAYVDTKLATAYDPLLKTYDADQLFSTFKGLGDLKPELAQKVIGKNAGALLDALNIKKAGNLISEQGIKSIDESTMRALLSLKDPTVADLRSLISMSKLRDTAYINTFFKDVADGVRDDNFRPTEFVTKLRNTSIPTEQVQTALSHLDSNTRNAISNAEFFRLLNASSVSEGETVTRSMQAKPINLSPTKLVNAIGTGADRDRVKLLLGDDLPAPGIKPPVIGIGEKGATRFEVLDALTRVLAPKEAAKTAFSALGSIGSGMAVRKLTTEPLKYAEGYVKNAILASAYIGGLGKLITNTTFDSEATAVLANTLIVSEPLIRVMNETFGDEMTKAIMINAKQSIDRFVREYYDSPEGRKRTATRQFMQGQQVPMKMGN